MNRITRAACLTGIGGFLLSGFFFLVWIEIVPADSSGDNRSIIGLNQLDHPTLFSGYNLGAWPTLVFGVLLLGASLISFVRPSRSLSLTSFVSLLVISLNIFWQGVGQTAEAHGYPSGDVVKYGGAVGLLSVSLVGLVISWYFVKRFRGVSVRLRRPTSSAAPVESPRADATQGSANELPIEKQREPLVGSFPDARGVMRSDPDLPYAPEDPRSQMSTAARVGISFVGVMIVLWLAIGLIHVIVSNSH